MQTEFTFKKDEKSSSPLKFMGWDEPILSSGARLLLERYAKAPALSLSHCTVVVPGERAGRTLLARLTRMAAEEGKALIPPRIATPGRVPELMYQSSTPLVTDLEAELLWASVLEANPKSMAKLLPRGPGGTQQKSEASRFTDRQSLGRRLMKVRNELAATGKPVAELLRQLVEEYVAAEDRFGVIAELFDKYDEALLSLGLTDIHSARLAALGSGEFIQGSNIILFGTLDLPPVANIFLEQSGSQYEAWIHAPEALACGFDSYGCVVPSFWRDFPIEVDDRVLRFGRTPAHQGEECARALSDWQTVASVDDVVIAAPDTVVVPFIEEALGDLGIPVRDASGVPKRLVGPIMMLTHLTRYLASGSIEDLGSLVRTPDFSSWLSSKSDQLGRFGSDLVSHLDEYQGQVLPMHLAGKLPGESDARECVEAILGVVNGLFPSPLGKKALASQWCNPIRDVLRTIYGDLKLRRGITSEKTVLESIESVQVALEEIEHTPTDILPALTFDEALSFVLKRLSAERIEPNTFDPAIELVGWLELYHDERPYVVVASCNEGLLPESANEDPFLPNAVRASVGITDNDIRYARDAAVLLALLHSRKDLRIIVGGLNGNGDLLAPSRLLLADPKRVAARVKSFYSATETTPSILVEDITQSAALLPQEPTGLKGKVSEASVTGFSLYRDCPYRFYLRYVQKLETLRDDARELDPRAFGSLGHDVLRRFSEDTKLAKSKNREVILAALSDLLDTEVRCRFGTQLLPAVKLQIAQLRHRLNLFGQWQSDWVSKGWQIEFVEHKLRGTIQTSLGLFGVNARVDRVDRNPTTNQYVVFDYKFGDIEKDLISRHAGKKALQLPLYRKLLAQAKISEDALVGVLPLSGSEDVLTEKIVALKDHDIAALEDEVTAIATGIYSGVFWPPADLKRPGDDFRWICGVGTAGDPDDEGEEGSDAE